MNKKWFIGIDVSKKTLDASIFVAGEVINRFPHIQVRNEKQGFKELLRWAKKQDVNTKDTLFGLEFTGYYSDALEQFLTGKKLCYTMLPTTVVKHYQRGTRDKNDKTGESTQPSKTDKTDESTEQAGGQNLFPVPVRLSGY